MKSGIHPKWNHQAVVSCGCGNTFVTGSTNDTVSVDVCSACHPFYTGKMKFLDAQGRVERFVNKRATAQQTLQKSKKKAEAKDKEVLSLRQMLEVEKKKLVASESKQTATMQAASSKQN